MLREVAPRSQREPGITQPRGHLSSDPVFLSQIGFTRSEAHEGVARRRPAGPPERSEEEGGIDKGVCVRRPARDDEQEHAAAGRCAGEDEERGEVVVRNALTTIVSQVYGIGSPVDHAT